MEEWISTKVYIYIKTRLKELHLLGISHNNIMPDNIHVSVSGKISLTDFGLSDCANNEDHKMNDFKCIDDILGINDYGHKRK